MEETGKITHFPLLYFAPISYYRSILREKQICFSRNDRYNKQTYRNRCEIYGANGKLSLSIPVHRPYGNKTRLSEVLLTDATPWRETHWKSIKSAYGRSPYFDYYGEKVEQLVLNPTNSLQTYLEDIAQQVMHWLDLTNYTFTKSIPSQQEQFSLDQIASKTYYKSNNHQEYWQVFSDKHGFIPNLSILDLLFNEGPQSRVFLMD
jgi:hypothetical protein